MNAKSLAVLMVQVYLEGQFVEVGAGDYKDCAAAQSFGYEVLIDELLFSHGYIVRTEIPDGYNYPRTFARRSDAELISEISAEFQKWGSKKRKAEKIRLRRYAATRR